MAESLRRELADELHGVGLGEAITCTYHARPTEIATDAPVQVEAIQLVDHPQLDEAPDHWVIDAARCSQHAVLTIEEPTRGYEEALVRVPIAAAPDGVSVATPAPKSIYVQDFKPATAGLAPMMFDQQLMEASEPGDMGYARWTRVLGWLAAEPPAPLREHLEELIAWSPETPEEW